MKKVVAFLAVAGLAAAANAQLGVVDNIPGGFIDISGTGTNIGNVGDDVSTAITLPAAYGNIVLPAGTVHVGSNGHVRDVVGSPFFNTELSDASVAGYYPYWDDLRTDNAGAGVFTQDMGDRFIIQWNDVGMFGNLTGNFGTFQIQIFAAGGPALAQFLYDDVDWGSVTGNNGGSATVGAVAAGDAPRDFAQYSFNEAVIQPGLVVSIVPAPGAAALLGVGGLLAARRRRA